MSGVLVLRCVCVCVCGWVGGCAIETHISILMCLYLRFHPNLHVWLNGCGEGNVAIGRLLGVG